MVERMVSFTLDSFTGWTGTTEVLSAPTLTPIVSRWTRSQVGLVQRCGLLLGARQVSFTLDSFTGWTGTVSALKTLLAIPPFHVGLVHRLDWYEIANYCHDCPLFGFTLDSFTGWTGTPPQTWLLKGKRSFSRAVGCGHRFLRTPF